MSCNCTNTKDCSTTCKCGIYIDVYEGESLLITYGANYNCECEGNATFSFTERNTLNVFHEDDREVIVRYSDYFNRWEMAFFNEDLSAYIPFALYYTSKISCPNSLDCWDTDTNVGYLIVDGVTVALLVWNGEIDSNGYKVYQYVASEYPGTWTESVTMSFDLADNRWKIYRDGIAIAEKTIVGPSDPAFDFTAIPPFSATTIIVDSFAGVPAVPGYTSPSGEKNIIKVREAECTCCITEVSETGSEGTVTYVINNDPSDVVEVGVDAFQDAYGNIIGSNGKATYSFDWLGESYTIEYDGTNWVMRLNGEDIAIGYGQGDCPIGFFELIGCNRLRVRGKRTGTGNFDEYLFPAGELNGKQYWEWTIDGQTYTLYYRILTPGVNEYWAVEDLATGNVKAEALGTIDTDCPPLDTQISSFSWTLNPLPPDAFTSFFVIDSYRNVNYIRFDGVDCDDHCDAFPQRNSNLLKKKKAIFVKEIADIRNQEIFGLKCGPSWDDLFKKHLIFDVLHNLPDQVICEEEEQCLINKLSENCKC